MKLALLLWLISALAAATAAAGQCSHFQMGLLFILLSALPSTAAACCGKRKKAKFSRKFSFPTGN